MKKALPVLLLVIVMAALAGTPAVAGGGPHCDPQITDGRTNEVRLAKNCFSPTITRIAPGEEVTFVSEDGVPHTITGALFKFGDMDEVLKGDERSFTFDDEGIYPYACMLHPGMAGAIVVGDGKGAGGYVAETTSFQANPAEEETTSDAQMSPTSAKDDTISWSVVPLALGALAVLAFLSVGFRRRVSAGVALTTKP